MAAKSNKTSGSSPAAAPAGTRQPSVKVKKKKQKKTSRGK